MATIRNGQTIRLASNKPRLAAKFHGPHARPLLREVGGERGGVPEKVARLSGVPHHREGDAMHAGPKRGHLSPTKKGAEFRPLFR